MKNQNTPNLRRLAVFLSIAFLGSVVFLTGCAESKRTEGLDGQTVTTPDGRKWLLRSKGLHNYGVYPILEDGKVQFP